MRTVSSTTWHTNSGDSRRDAHNAESERPEPEENRTVSRKPQSIVSASHQALIDHVARYRITVREAVEHAFAKSFGATRRMFTQAVRDGHLDVAPLYRNRRYCHLTQLGANSVDTSASSDDRPKHGPLSEPAKVRAYAMLVFCCLHDVPRERLTADDFQTHFPDLYRPGMSANYYIDTTGNRPRIGLLRVDFGGRGRWDRIISRVRRDIEAHYLAAGFRRLLARQSFEITVVTALPQKAGRIRQALAGHCDARRVPIRVVAMPDLLHLVMPPPTPVVTDRRPTTQSQHSANGGFDSLPSPGARKNNGQRVS